MANDDSRNILLVLLIGGVLYMIMKTDEKDTQKTTDKKIEAVIEKKVKDWKEAEELFKTKKEDQDEGWWMKMFLQCQRGIPHFFRSIQQLEHQGQQSLDQPTNYIVVQWLRTIRYLIAAMDEYFPPKTHSIRGRRIRRQVQELNGMCEYMASYDARNNRPRVRRPLNRDAGEGPGADRPSSENDRRKKEANQDIRDQFGANKKPDPGKEKTDMEIDTQQREEGQEIKDRFGTNRSQSEKLTTILEGNDEGEDPTTTDQAASSSFVQGGGSGKTDVDDDGAKERNDARNTSDPSKPQAPEKLKPGKQQGVKPTREQFDTAPQRIGTSDPPPAPSKPRRDRSQSLPGAGPGPSNKRQKIDEEERRKIQEGFNASNDSIIGGPQPTASEITPVETFDAAYVKARLVMLTNNRQVYGQDLAILVQRAKDFIDKNPIPTPALQAKARQIWDNLKLHVPPTNELKGHIFWAANWPAVYGMQFTKEARELVKGNPLFRMWSRAENHMSLLLKEYIKEHVPDLTSEELADAAGQSAKRKKPSRKRSQSVAR